MLNRMFGTVDFLKLALDGSSLKHEVISNNIANVNTPGYKRKVVDFENVLKSKLIESGVKLYTTNNKHIGGDKENNPDFSIKENKNYLVRRDGNSVNIDVEVAERAKNEIYYNAVITQLSRQFEAINSVINNEGGR